MISNYTMSTLAIKEYLTANYRDVPEIKFKIEQKIRFVEMINTQFKICLFLYAVWCTFILLGEIFLFGKFEIIDTLIEIFVLIASIMGTLLILE